MENGLRSKWASGASGKRQVAVAGFVLLAVFAGGIPALWISQRPPIRYDLLLEGQDAKGHYFTMLAVACRTRWQARALALSAAKRQGLRIVDVAEMEAKGVAPRSAGSKVLKAPWRKTYFEEDEHSHEHSH